MLFKLENWIKGKRKGSQVNSIMKSVHIFIAGFQEESIWDGLGISHVVLM